jgi:hypothetical protein
VCATGLKRLQAFFLAGDSSLSWEVADSKIRVQSASTLSILYMTELNLSSQERRVPLIDSRGMCPGVPKWLHARQPWKQAV